MDIQDAARKALEKPDSFYTSDDNIGTTHALTASVHRDSDVLDQSNWEVIKDDMVERFPNDVYVHGSSHWAVGWTDQLAVRVYVYPHPAVGVIISDAFKAIVEWKGKLEDYPVADESHYSEMEYEDAIETLENCYNVSKEKSGEAFSWLFDSYSYCSAEEYNEDAVAEAIAAIGDDCQECQMVSASETKISQLTYGTMKRAVCASCATGH
jgi:hypothetical protein